VPLVLLSTIRHRDRPLTITIAKLKVAVKPRGYKLAVMMDSDSKFVRDAITRCFRSGNAEAAVRLFEMHRGKLSEAARLEYLGNLHFYQRHLQEAIDNYEAAIALEPDHFISRYQYLIGTQAEKNGDLTLAFQRYQNAIEIEPEFVDAYVELGGLLAKVGDLEGAAQAYRDALRLVPHELANANNLRAILMKLSSADPDKYQNELISTDALYQKLLSEGKALPQGQEW
jgi:tetratricopeptide (TPR) repeat protein